MTSFAEAAFWACVAWLLYPFVGYPLVLKLVAVFGKKRFGASRDYLPSVSVLIAARNEARHIKCKIEETLAWDYPADCLEVLVASDASEDDTDKILQSLACARLRFVRMPVRTGKNRALNRLAQLARGELLLFCDANSHIPAGVLRNLVTHFADERVGCVTGAERTVAEANDFTMAAGNSAFLRYEAFVNQLESSVGSVLACDGALFCMRHGLFRQLDAALANDLELPIYVGSAGRAVLFEPTAVAFETASRSAAEELKRRRRICGQGALAWWRLREAHRGIRAWQFISRKLLRWIAVLPMLGIFITSIVLAGNQFFAIVLALQVIFYFLALLGLFAAMLRLRAAKLVDLPFFFMLGNMGAFVGVLDTILGRRYAVWQPITRAGTGTDMAGRRA